MTSSTSDLETPRKSALPMMLTLARMAAAPIIAALVLWAANEVYVDRTRAGLLYGGAAALFILAALTDWLDGYLARKLDAITPLGAALDHCADKVLIACVLVALAYAAFPTHLVVAAVIILGRDIAIAGLREGMSASGRALPVNQLGKWKAAAEMAGIAVFLALQAAGLLGAAPDIVLALDWSASALIWAGAALAVVSGTIYAATATVRGGGPSSEGGYSCFGRCRVNGGDANDPAAAQNH